METVGRVMQDPEELERLKARALELAKRVGKEAALDAARKQGAPPETLEALRRELENL